MKWEYEMRPDKKMEKLHQCGLVEAVRRFMLKPHALFIEGSDAISRQMCIVEPIKDLNFNLRINPNQCGLFGQLRSQNDPLRDSGL